MVCGVLRGSRRSRDDFRRHPHSIVGDGGDHGRQLNGRNSNLLPHGNGANRNLRPAADRFGQSARLGGQFNSRLLPKAIGPDVFVEPVISQPQRHLDGAHIARVRQNAGHG